MDIDLFFHDHGSPGKTCSSIKNVSMIHIVIRNTLDTLPNLPLLYFKTRFVKTCRKSKNPIQKMQRFADMLKLR